MKYLFSIIFLVAFSFSSAQKIEEEISTKACDCIRLKLMETNEIYKEEINICIGTSLDEVLKSKSEKEAKKFMKNMNSFVEKMRLIYKTLDENCLPKNKK